MKLWNWWVAGVLLFCSSAMWRDVDLGCELKVPGGQAMRIGIYLRPWPPSELAPLALILVVGSAYVMVASYLLVCRSRSEKDEE